MIGISAFLIIPVYALLQNVYDRDQQSKVIV